MVNFKVFKI